MFLFLFASASFTCLKGSMDMNTGKTVLSMLDIEADISEKFRKAEASVKDKNITSNSRFERFLNRKHKCLIIWLMSVACISQTIFIIMKMSDHSGVISETNQGSYNASLILIEILKRLSDSKK